MTAEASPYERRPSWQVIHAGSVYEAIAEDGAVCTHAQAVEAVERGVRYKGDRMMMTRALTIRIERLSGDAGPDRALYMGQGASLGSFAVTDWREDTSAALDNLPAQRIPFDTRAATAKSRAAYNEAKATEALLLAVAAPLAPLYQQMRRMSDGPRLRNLLDQAESYHASALRDLAEAKIQIDGERRLNREAWAKLERIQAASRELVAALEDA